MVSGVHGGTVNNFKTPFVFFYSGKVNERGHCENMDVSGKLTLT